MVKILSQAGRSLADMYQAVGSVAGIDQLETRELPIVHEMGATIFSERFRTTIRRLASAQLIQNATFDLELNTLPSAITRLVGVQIISDDATRISNAQFSLFDPVADQDFPVWVYSGNTRPVRIRDGAATVAVDLLLGEVGTLVFPAWTGGEDQGSSPVEDIRLRGLTTGFGAGNVTITAIMFIAFTFTGGVSSFGAHVPSW